MASSTRTLLVNTTSAPPDIAQNLSHKSPGHDIEMTDLPSRRHTLGQEGMGMTGNKASVSGSVPFPQNIPAWTMSAKDEWVAIAACCWCLFMAGWNDATTGPLLPTIQAHYNVNFTVVSMLFVSNRVGYLSAAGINIYLTDRLGFGKLMLLGAVLQMLAYSILAPALPFPVLCVGYAINGFGLALKSAQANGFIAGLPNNASTKMGLLHAGYGAGALVAPLVATRFAQLPRWSFHYLISLGVSAVDATIVLTVFKLRRQHDVMGLPDPMAEQTGVEGPQSSRGGENRYKEIFSSRLVQLVALFSWVYVGVEVTIGGKWMALIRRWIVTFVIEERGGGASAGYISSGFFGGLMLGRVVLLWVNEKVGERLVVYVYCLLCIALELVVWFVPNIIGNAVAVSIVGMLLGNPLYPIAMNLTGKLVPKRILTGSIGWIASFGQAGSAVFPFITGALAQKHGVKVLQPMLVGMLSALVVLWMLIPAGQKRRGD